MQLKKYLVMKGPTEELEIWPRTQYEQYIQGCVDFGAGSAYGIITHFDEQDRLLTDPPASAEEEAEKLYPDDNTKMWSEYTYNQMLIEKRSAHITCAGMYQGEIDKLKAENSKMRLALEWVPVENMPEDEKSASWEQRNETYNICVTTPAGYSHVSCGYMKDEIWHWLESNKPVSMGFTVTHYTRLPDSPIATEALKTT